MFNAAQKATQIINQWLRETSGKPVTLQVARLGIRLTEALNEAYEAGANSVLLRDIDAPAHEEGKQ